jgi:hypothetical protein
MGKTFLNRIEEAWKVLWKSDESTKIQVITEDMKTFALIKEQTNQFEQNAMMKRLERLERTLNHVMIKMNEISEYQKATHEVMVAFSTASEEISHGFEMLADSLTTAPVETKKTTPKSSIEALTQYADPNGRKKSNIN